MKEARRYVLVMGALVLAVAVLAWVLPAGLATPRWCLLALGGLGAGLIGVFFWSGVEPLPALLAGAAAVTVLLILGMVLGGESSPLVAAVRVFLCLLPVAYGIRSAWRVRRDAGRQRGAGDSPPAV